MSDQYGQQPPTSGADTGSNYAFAAPGGDPAAQAGDSQGPSQQLPQGFPEIPVIYGWTPHQVTRLIQLRGFNQLPLSEHYPQHSYGEVFRVFQQEFGPSCPSANMNSLKHVYYKYAAPAVIAAGYQAIKFQPAHAERHEAPPGFQPGPGQFGPGGANAGRYVPIQPRYGPPPAAPPTPDRLYHGRGQLGLGGSNAGIPPTFGAPPQVSQPSYGEQYEPSQPGYGSSYAPTTVMAQPLMPYEGGSGDSSSQPQQVSAAPAAFDPDARLNLVANMDLFILAEGYRVHMGWTTWEQAQSDYEGEFEEHASTHPSPGSLQLRYEYLQGQYMRQSGFDEAA
ncbi:hypothetical protein Daus18300_004540 [Diaporthe australafricana]|uniref:Uncharacterized protein n=1 Tax=Diaporthe australafricana TaxID=127596 RepID=A0ABR3X7H0_9PEZI